jgi:hypothetical protein
MPVYKIGWETDWLEAIERTPKRASRSAGDWRRHIGEVQQAVHIIGAQPCCADAAQHELHRQPGKLQIHN